MIQVSLKNYTTIKSADFIIRGLTVLRANSNGGKSSVVNAINAGVTAEFPPSALRWGESEADITLQFADGAVNLHRVGTSTTYKIATASGLNEQYAKLNRKLPEQVVEFLNLCIVSVGDAPYCMNFHQQFAPPLSLAMSHNRFVSFLSASDLLEEHKGVSKKLTGKAYELQGSINSFSSLLETTQSSLAVKQQRLDYLTQFGVQLDAKYKEVVKIQQSIAAVASLNQQLQAVQSLTVSANQKNEDIEKLTGLITKLSELTPLKSSVRSLADVKGKMDSVLLLSQRSQDSSVRIEKLGALLQSASGVEEKRKAVNSLLTLATQASAVTQSSNSLKTKESLLERLDALLQKGTDVSALRAKIQQLSLLGSTLTQVASLTKSKEDKENILTNNLCPMCAQPLGGHTH